MHSEQQFSYSTVSCFKCMNILYIKERPSSNIRYLINRQLAKLI